MLDLKKEIEISSSNLTLLGRLINVVILLSLAGLFIFGSHYLIFTLLGAEAGASIFVDIFLSTTLAVIGLFCSLVIVPPILVIFLNIFYYIIKNELLDVNMLVENILEFLHSVKNGYIFYLKYFFGDWRKNNESAT